MLEPAHLVPGHGEIATLANVTLIESYINTLLQMAEQNFRNGGTTESAAALQPPSFIEGFELSMKFLHEMAQQK